MMRGWFVLFMLPLAWGCDRTRELPFPDHPMGLAAATLQDTTFTWRTREKRFMPRIDVFHLKSRDQMKRITEYSERRTS